MTLFSTWIAGRTDQGRWHEMTFTQIELLHENRNLNRDLVVAIRYAGPRPAWVWPTWLYGSAWA